MVRIKELQNFPNFDFFDLTETYLQLTTYTHPPTPLGMRISVNSRIAYG